MSRKSTITLTRLALVPAMVALTACGTAAPPSTLDPAPDQATEAAVEAGLVWDGLYTGAQQQVCRAYATADTDSWRWPIHGPDFDRLQQAWVLELAQRCNRDGTVDVTP